MRQLAFVAATLVVLTGCDKLTGTKPDPAASASAGTTGAVPTGAAAATGAATATAAATGTATASAAAGTATVAGGNPQGIPTAQINNGAKQVGLDTSSGGTALNLKNDAGTGKVTNSSGGVQITGKDGKTINIPTGGAGIPGMPR